MPTQNILPADASAERIVRHFQGEGFPGITEALLVKVRLKRGDRLEIDAAFATAMERETTPPVQQFFEIAAYGFYSQIRSLDEAKSAFSTDFDKALRFELPDAYFDSAPVVVHNALASGTKYDAMVKFENNSEGSAVLILLNDPNSSFFEYLGSHVGYDWHKIVGTLDAAAASYLPANELR